jgi:hypothetical protein
MGAGGMEDCDGISFSGKVPVVSGTALKIS